MEPTRSKPKLYCHTIDSKTATADPSATQKLFDLSQSVFSEIPETDPTNLEQDMFLPSSKAPSNDIRAWQWSMQQPTSILLYASTSPTPDPSSALGVFLGMPRTQLEIGYELFHLRIAAVSASSRGLGIFPMLMERVQEHVRICGYKEMTVSTYPKRFTKMYRILREHGWRVVEGREGREGRKHVLLKIAL